MFQMCAPLQITKFYFGVLGLGVVLTPGLGVITKKFFKIWHFETIYGITPPNLFPIENQTSSLVVN